LAAVLALASVTATLTKFATHAIGSLGLAGVGLLTLSTGVVGLPGTEPTMLFAGFDVYNGTLPLAGVIALGLVGDLLGAGIAYAIGYYAREEIQGRRGRALHVSGRRVQRAQGWFERYGTPVLLLSRVMPVVRSAFPYAAGVAEVPFARFAVLTTIGSIPWIAGLAVLGREVGSNWSSWRHHLEYVDYVGIAVVVAALAYLIVRWRRGRMTGGRPAVDVAPD
jgi:membrane protein DedA with SNARE-associated domain